MRDVHLLELLVAVDLVAYDLSKWILTWKSRHRERDVPARDRQKLLKRILRIRFESHFLEQESQHAEKELRDLDARMHGLKRGRETGEVFRIAPLRLHEVKGALEDLIEASILRVFEIRDDEPRYVKYAAWLDAFHRACLQTTPRLITPSITPRTLDKTLERLRRKADLTSELKKLRVRRSVRDIGAARLRSWGFVFAGRNE